MLLHLFLPLLLIAIFAEAIYEDQVGKFDWRHQYIGCANQIHLDRTKSPKSDLIYLTTESNVLAALRTNTGNIAWRQIHEQNSSSPPIFAFRNRMLISLARNAGVVRAWERETGSLVWETQIHSLPARPISLMASYEGAVFILDTLSLTALSLSNGHLKWSQHIDSKNKQWIGIVQGSQLLTLIGGTNGRNVEINRFDAQTGISAKKQLIDAEWFNNERCILSGTMLLCNDDRSATVYIVDVSSDPSAVQQINFNSNNNNNKNNINNNNGIVNEIIPLKVDGFIAIRSQRNIHLYRVAPSQTPQQLLMLEKADAISAIRTADGRNLIATFSGTVELKIYDLSSAKLLLESRFPSNQRHSPIKLFTFAPNGNEYEFVTITHDCQIDFFIIIPFIYNTDNNSNNINNNNNNDKKKTHIAIEWSRHEALSTVSAVRMVDLPLSEAQVGIESEFNSQDSGIMESLIRRLRSQIKQFHRVFKRATQQLFSASNLLNIRKKSFAEWMSSLHLSSSLSGHRDTHHHHSSDSPLERDFFNLRKIIVISTLKSILFGLDSSDGSIIWRLHLGTDTVPLQESLGEQAVPLFIQRTTAHYQHSALGAVALANKYTRNGIIVQFDPITGKLIERIDLPYRLKKAHKLPIIDRDNINPLLLVDTFNGVSTYPRLSNESNDSSKAMPIHVFDYDRHGQLEGYRLDVQKMRLERVWSANLHLSSQQRIVAAISKPHHQRVHSPGKVLGDRSVLYKYSNPNLVAIAIVDSLHSVLHIEFVDAVSGYVVYKAKQAKVSGPIHLVQCENWLTYSYWSEKNRRMEIAVIELYEGIEQTDELRFNSLSPTIPPVVHAITQAYIFPQGVSALGVTETEQGLSTRSLLIAMPFGGIYGISKRIIDARRPLEMTAELAEEMLIPYRPELPIASEDFVNYNQSVYNIRAIKASPSGLESTSLMFAYGLDMFFARLTPSGTFDILKDDFDHLLISLVLVALVIASFICKKLGRNHSLKQAWQ